MLQQSKRDARHRASPSTSTVTAMDVDEDNTVPPAVPVRLRHQPVATVSVPTADTHDEDCEEAEDKDYNVLEDDDDVDDTPAYQAAGGKYVIESKLSFRDQLARWAVFFSVPAIALSVLLKILVVYGVTPDLPKDSRTLLQTARCVVTKKIAGGEYFHFGIEEGLSFQLKALKQSVFDNLPNVLRLIVSSDGLPVFKSVNTHVWPISASIFVHEKVARPFTIGVFYGVDKLMKVHEFLADFVTDFRLCSTDGFRCRGRRFTVALHCITADAPARAMLKNVMYHSASNGCERCTVKGVKLSGMTFNGEFHDRRTDETLLDENEDEHRKGNSPLSAIGVKLITHFVLDYMHLVLLGVMRKLLYLWLEGEVGTAAQFRTYRLAAGEIRNVSSRLTLCIETCPKEFARKPRSLASFRMFKATECRTLLLYTGFVAFKCDVIRRDVYKNYLLLACAMRIYLHEVQCKSSLRYKARRWLYEFVDTYRNLYGKEHVVYNVRNLIHLQHDVKQYGNLDKVSAFPFENYLQAFKRMIRHGHNTMQQLVRRLDEQRRHGVQAEELFQSESSKKYLHAHALDLPISLKRYAADVKNQFKAIDYGSVRFSVFSGDSCIRLNDGSVGKVMNILQMYDDSTLIVYRTYEYRRPYFEDPIDSQIIGISKVRHLSVVLRVVEVEECKKAWLLPQQDSNWYIAVNLL